MKISWKLEHIMSFLQRMAFLARLRRPKEGIEPPLATPRLHLVGRNEAFDRRAIGVLLTNWKSPEAQVLLDAIKKTPRRRPQLRLVD